MAARTNRIFHSEADRKRIQTSQLLNRLQDNALGKLDLSPGAIKSIEILLKKTIPDLSAVQHSNDPDAPMPGAIAMIPVPVDGK